MKSVSYENKVVLGFIDFVLFIMKWLSLCVSVIMTSLTIGLIVMNLVENSPTPSNFFVSMVSAITSYSFNDASVLVGNIGKMNALVGTTGLGIVLAVNFALLYMITTNFRIIFKSFSYGKLFTKDNLMIIEKIVPMTLLYAFALPVIKFFLVISVGMLNFADINVSGLIFVFIAVIIKMLLERGYVLETKLEKKELELSDIKAKESEMKIDLIKKDSVITDLKSEKKEKNETKKQEAKKAKKKSETTTKNK